MRIICSSTVFFVWSSYSSIKWQSLQAQVDTEVPNWLNIEVMHCIFNTNNIVLQNIIHSKSELYRQVFWFTVGVYLVSMSGGSQQFTKMAVQLCYIPAKLSSLPLAGVRIAIACLCTFSYPPIMSQCLFFSK